MRIDSCISIAPTKNVVEVDSNDMTMTLRFVKIGQELHTLHDDIFFVNREGRPKWHIRKTSLQCHSIFEMQIHNTYIAAIIRILNSCLIGREPLFVFGRS
jgi:hypothetical protein